MSSETNRPTEAAVVADLAARNVLLGSQPKPIQTTGSGGRPFTILVESNGAQKVADLSAFEPPRKKAKAAFCEMGGFTDYVNLYADNHSRLFCDVERRAFTAILDYHDAKASDAEGRRGEHVATLLLRLTPTMEAWLKLAKDPIDQAVLAEFLEDRYQDIVEPSGADILELAKTLEVKNDVAFKSAQRSADGGYDLRYQETIAAKAGQTGSLTIPTKFLLAIQVFQGGKVVRLPMRLRFRLADGNVVFLITFLGLEDLIRDEVDRVRAAIAEATSRPVWAGSATIG